MRKALLFLSLMLSQLSISAQSAMGNLTISDIELAPGGASGYIYVGLENSEIVYATYSLDILLPDDIDVCLDEEGNYDVFFDDDDSEIYPYSRKTGYYHSIRGNVITLNGRKSLRVYCGDPVSGKAFEQENGRLFYVQIKASSYMKPGDAQIEIANIALVEQDGTKHVPSNPLSTVSVTNVGKATLTVSSANHWSTCILPFATEIPAGVKVYTSSTSDAEKIFLTEVNSIEAYTPYILYSENGYSGTVSGTVDASGYPESGIVTVGNLTGAIVPQTVKNGYILQKHDGVVQFYAIEDGDSFLVPAGKCWMNIAANDAKALNCVVEGNETAIQNVKSTSIQNGVYDLAGRRVSTLKQGGLYIKNGEKFVGK